MEEKAFYICILLDAKIWLLQCALFGSTLKDYGETHLVQIAATYLLGSTAKHYVLHHPRKYIGFAQGVDFDLLSPVCLLSWLSEKSSFHPSLTVIDEVSWCIQADCP